MISNLRISNWESQIEMLEWCFQWKAFVTRRFEMLFFLTAPFEELCRGGYYQQSIGLLELQVSVTHLDRKPLVIAFQSCSFKHFSGLIPITFYQTVLFFAISQVDVFLLVFSSCSLIFFSWYSLDDKPVEDLAASGISNWDIEMQSSKWAIVENFEVWICKLWNHLGDYSCLSYPKILLFVDLKTELIGKQNVFLDFQLIFTCLGWIKIQLANSELVIRLTSLIGKLNWLRIV